MGQDEKDLRNAVKNAKSAFYNFKGKKRKQTRKDIRHASRTLKKSKQHQFQQNKHNVEIASDKVDATKPLKRKRKRKKKKKITTTSNELSIEKELYEANNKADEELISSLGKKLGMKKKNHLPTVFKQDGLDYILEVCEPLTEGAENYSSDEEYLAKKSKRPRVVKNKEEKNEKCSSDTLLFEDGEYGNEDGNDEDDGEYGNGEDGESEDMDGQGNNELVEEDMVTDDEIANENEYEDGNGDGDEIIKTEKGGHKDRGLMKDDDNDEINEESANKNIKNTMKSSGSSKYIPPALRKSQNSNNDKQKMDETRIKKKLKGLLNRVCEGALPGIVAEIEKIYSTNSRNFMNETLYNMIFEVCVNTTLLPEILIIQHMVIVAALHELTHTEVGSYFLQKLAERFSTLHGDSPMYGEGKTCHNVLLMLTSLYNLKVVDCILIYDLIRTCLDNFAEKDIEMVFLILKFCGADLRKDDPAALKDIIVTVQTKSLEMKIADQSYVQFMLNTINALKNNNMRKIPQYNPIVVEDARKCLKLIIHGNARASSGVKLKVSLNDLLNAGKKGQWWITGSAWTGRGPVEEVNPATDEKTTEDDFSSALQNAAKKQRMNSKLRKQIFCVMLSSEDYIDAFERLLKLNLTERQSREIIHVLVDCSLQEKSYNPFYTYLANKLCEFNKSNQVTLQYSIWDRFQILPTMKKYSRSNMVQFLAHMIASKSLSFTVLKKVSFGGLDKISIRFFSDFFKTLLLEYPENSIKAAFQRISSIPKLSLLRQGIKLFLRHFLYPDSNTDDSNIDIGAHKLREVIEIAESALDGSDYVPL